MGSRTSSNNAKTTHRTRKPNATTTHPIPINATVPSPRAPVLTPDDLLLEAPPSNAHNDVFYRSSIIGIDETFHSPFGFDRLLTYADWTASGRAVSFIEQYFHDYILPRYGNSHTEDDLTGRFSTHILHDAEKTIKECVNAGEPGKVIAYGTGATGAITKLQQILGIFIPPATRQILNLLTSGFLNDATRQQELEDFMEKRRPVVFVGPYEHHSNEVSWRQGFATVVEVAEDTSGNVDLQDLERLLKQYSDHHLLIGSFCAGSNVTGMMAPVHDICRLLHTYGAVACFDYAASGPYVNIDMNPINDKEGRIDAIYLSPHKFLGGPGSCGLLVFNAAIYDCSLAPSVGGGGTVLYVSPSEHDFIGDVEEREKAGTPGMLQIVRAALALDLKRKIGADNIEKRESELVHFAMREMNQHPNINVLGNVDVERNGIISFNIIDPRPVPPGAKSTRFLHPKFVTSLLNDLFGIQSRGGCSCAGPLGHRLLKIDSSRSQRYRDVIVKKQLGGFKLGWARIGVHYTMDDAEVQFLVSCVKFVADKGYLFLRMYDFDPASGRWTFSRGGKGEEEEHHRFGIDVVLQSSSLSSPRHEQKSLTDAARHDLYKTYMNMAQSLADGLLQEKPNAKDATKQQCLSCMEEFSDVQFFNLE